MGRVRIALFLVLAAVCAGIYFYSLEGGGENRDIGSVVRKYGFTEVVPPSKLLGPGAIVTIIQTNPLIVNLTCTELSSLGSTVFTNLTSSASQNANLTADLSGAFNLGGSFLKHFVTSANSHYVRKITVTLSNVKITEIPDDVVIDLSRNRKLDCIKAITFRQGQGKTVSMIKSVLEANALYQVQFTDDSDLQTRSKLTQNLAANLGLANGEVSDNTIHGDGLIWGLRDDMDLAAFSTSTALTNGPPSTGSTEHRRALSTKESVKIVLQ